LYPVRRDTSGSTTKKLSGFHSASKKTREQRHLSLNKAKSSPLKDDEEFIYDDILEQNENDDTKEENKQPLRNNFKSPIYIQDEYAAQLDMENLKCKRNLFNNNNSAFIPALDLNRV
jgi:hypothetical protein